MTQTVTGLIQRARRMIGDFPEIDVTTTTTTTASTSVVVADTSIYQKGSHIVIEDESMRVTAIANTTTLTVIRGYQGTTAVEHASGSKVLADPLASAADYLDGLNEGLRYLWPNFFVYVEDTSLTAVNDTSDYELPDSLKDGRVLRVQVLEAGGLPTAWYEWRQFEIRRDATDSVGEKIHFTNWPPPAGSSIKLIGLGRYTTDLAIGTAIPTNVSDAALSCLPSYAAYYVLSQAEARRNRITRAQNIGPAASPAGANSNLAVAMFNKFMAMKAMLGEPWPEFYARRRM